MIFPGMDPYLENAQLWPDVHASFIVYLREHLRPLLQPRYVIAIESRVFVEGPGADHSSVKVRRTSVEIDLLRTGPHVVAIPEWAARQHGPYDYLICVNSSGGLRDRFQLYPRGLRQRLPRIRLPLAAPDPDAVLDLQAVLARAYEAGGYTDRVDYGQPCRPVLSPEDQAWADALRRAVEE